MSKMKPRKKFLTLFWPSNNLSLTLAFTSLAFQDLCISLRKIPLLLFMCVSLYVHINAGTHGGQRGGMPLELELQMCEPSNKSAGN